MNKVLAVARTEYLNAVRSKAFIIGVVLMPVMMGGALVVQKLLEGRVDVDDRVCIVVDGTGELLEVIQERAKARNARDIFEWEEDQRGRQYEPRFLFEAPGEAATTGERADVLLSERVEGGEAIAFLVIDEETLAPEPPLQKKLIAYHTATPTYRDLPRWIDRVLNEEIRRRRFEAAGIEQSMVEKLNRKVRLATLGLTSVDSEGNVQDAVEENEIANFAVPMASMMLLFMLIMMSAPTLLNQVLEEKMQKISEVLISAVSPFQLMMGKLLGATLVSMTLSVLYLGAVFYVTHRFGVNDLVPVSTYVWFVVFQIMALLMFGSIFSAMGAACSELRDAQSLMMPVMILIMIPLFCWTVILKDPSSTFSRVMSLFPPATPMLMLLRINLPPGPPWWEIVLGLVLVSAFTVGCVWAGGKIFRIGMLSQGQSPTVGRLVTWVFSK